jgi:type II secretory pathway component GspD/PulD (secretin)
VRQIPIVTERTITNKENRIRQGESMIIGGIRKTEKRSVIRGVPVLKDIPLIGVLFSSKDFEERAKEIVFIVTPTISRGGPDNASMVEWLKKKHEAPVGPTQLHEQLLDIIDPHGDEDQDPNENSEVYGPARRAGEIKTESRGNSGDYWELDPIQRSASGATPAPADPDAGATLPPAQTALDAEENPGDTSSSNK